MKKFTRRTALSLITVFVAISFVGITAVAQVNSRAANIKSTGIIDFKDGAAVIDTTDFIYLANEIDLLESTYKTEIVSSLNDMGTYFTSEGSVTHNIDENLIMPESAEMLAFGQLTNGILNSQSIPEDKSYSGILPGSDETVIGTLSAATADNLSLGTAAWVNGELLCGTGGDNNSYYTRGFVEGQAVALDALDVQYTYHVHVDNDGNKITSDSILIEYGGCATNGFHKHTDSCYKECKVTKRVSHTTAPGVDGNTSTVYHMVEEHSGCGQATTIYSSMSNETTSYTHQYTTCGNTPINAYKIGCGKTEESIESATIVFK